MVLWAYQGYGFHEDGLKAGMIAANGLLNMRCEILNDPKHMASSFMETGARFFVARFLQDYIPTAYGQFNFIRRGTMLTFEGTRKKSTLKVYLKIHNPQYCWKVIHFLQEPAQLLDHLLSGNLPADCYRS